MRDLTNDYPVTQHMISTLQVLSDADIQADTSWLTAPIVVSSNDERHALNISQAQRYAIEKKVPILRWKRPLKIANDLGEHMCSLLYEHQPRLTGLFIEGAPATLVENLNATDGLANGTPLIMHSVVLSEDDNSENLSKLISEASPGTIIDITAPYALVVSVPSIDPVKWSNKHSTLVDGEVVIPLVNTNHRSAKFKLSADQTLHYQSHRLDLAFAVTYHKMQGQTCDKVILDINKRPGQLFQLGFHALYVGWSRVKFGNNIRILPDQNDDKFKHLLTFAPKSCLREWLQNVSKLEDQEKEEEEEEEIMNRNTI
jgi:hypothetical protein